MRVELLYAPGCSSYKSARNTLETLIAQEGLPVPIELVENTEQKHGEPQLRIHGNNVHTSSASQHIEHMRDAICKHWQELTGEQLIRLT
jgi:hypothetical protein